MSARIKRVVGIFPSTSGNTRLFVEFYDRGDMNYYMDKEGNLHIGKSHNKYTLDDPLEAFKEFEWAEKTWKKGNSDVVTLELNEKNDPDRYRKAVALCMKLQDPTEREKQFERAMAIRKGTSTIKESPDLNRVLKGIKKQIQKENSAQPATGNTLQTTQQPPDSAVKPETEQPVTGASNDQKVNFLHEGSQIDKFNKRYEKKKGV